jgi:ribosome maturation factor RimP
LSGNFGNLGKGKAPRKAGGSAPRRPAVGKARPVADVRPVAAVPSGPRLGWREAISGTVTGLGFELVDVERAQRGLLRVYIDRIAGRTYSLPGEFITVDDCEQVTRQLQYALEVEGLDYARLEVSSPGLDRPLRTEADFERFAGQAVHIALKAPFQGRKTWQGVLNRSEDNTGWSLVFKDGKSEQALGFKFDEVREARLVPVVDFKGRKSSKDSDPTGAAAVNAAPGSDGG